jgi:hypothetical protein
MSDEIVGDRLSTIPDDMRKPKEHEILKQTPIRMHVNDHRLLKVMLKKDHLSINKFMGYCVKAYMDGDPGMLCMLKNYRELDLVPQMVKDKHVLSHRERQSIMDEIEREIP